jgi:hypothetical protein
MCARVYPVLRTSKSPKFDLDQCKSIECCQRVPLMYIGEDPICLEKFTPGIPFQDQKAAIKLDLGFSIDFGEEKDEISISSVGNILMVPVYSGKNNSKLASIWLINMSTTEAFIFFRHSFVAWFYFMSGNAIRFKEVGTHDEIIDKSSSTTQKDTRVVFDDLIGRFEINDLRRLHEDIGAYLENVQSTRPEKEGPTVQCTGESVCAGLLMKIPLWNYLTPFLYEQYKSLPIDTEPTTWTRQNIRKWIDSYGKKDIPPPIAYFDKCEEGAMTEKLAYEIISKESTRGYWQFIPQENLTVAVLCKLARVLPWDIMYIRPEIWKKEVFDQAVGEVVARDHGKLYEFLNRICLFGSELYLTDPEKAEEIFVYLCATRPALFISVFDAYFVKEAGGEPTGLEIRKGVYNKVLEHHPHLIKYVIDAVPDLKLSVTGI